MIGTVPEAFRADSIANMPWRAEAVAYGTQPRFPAGLRMPDLYGIVDLGDDRLEIWMEDVPVDSSAWDLARYDRAARLLGRFAADHPAEPLPDSGCSTRSTSCRTRWSTATPARTT